MAWLETFRGLLDKGDQDKKRVAEGLREAHRGFLERAARFELTAERAPSDSAESSLRRLATEHRATTALIESALAARSSSARGGAGKLVASEGINHWARIVEDLEVLQQGRNRILELARDLIDLDPELIDLFDVLTRRMNEHVTRLRGEIAEADPQALN